MGSSLKQGSCLGPSKILRHSSNKDPQRGPNLENYPHVMTDLWLPYSWPYLLTESRDPSCKPPKPEPEPLIRIPKL